MCPIITAMWTDACLVAVAGNMVSWHRFVMPGVVSMCHGGCGWLNEGCGRWWLLVVVVT